MNLNVIHDGVLLLLGGILKTAIDQLIEVWHINRKKPQPVEAPLTLPSYYGNRPTTHVERVSSMLDRLEEK